MRKNKEKTKTSETDYGCPSCDRPLSHIWGNQIHPGDKNYGVTLFCDNGDSSGKNHPQEVSGHGIGRTEEAMLQHAYAIIRAKFCGAKLETDEPEPVEVAAKDDSAI